MKDRDVIDAFVAHLRGQGHPYLKVDRRPDAENRETSDIDAIAGSIAIEHTSVDIALMNDWKMLDAIQKAYPNRPPHGIDQIWYADTSVIGEIEFRNFTCDLRKKDCPTTGCTGTR